jgi:hypothetical protein
VLAGTAAGYVADKWGGAAIGGISGLALDGGLEVLKVRL